MQHTILFTIIPRGIAQNSATLPVSVLVSPRLSDGQLLAQFPDWLKWTERIKANGLTFTIQCQNQVQTFQAPVEGLQPELWDRLFNENTRVNPFEFQDFKDRGVYSYSVRRVMSALKETYQQAGVLLALPEDDFLSGKRDIGRRYLLQNMIRDYGVRWDREQAKSAQQKYRRTLRPNRLQYSGRQNFAQPGQLAGDGTLKPGLNTDKNELATEFSNFHRQPQPENYNTLKDNPPDYEKMFDFHQAITAVNNYPALQRALGLVFDLELPLDFVAATSTAAGEVLRMQAVQPGWDWEIHPHIPDLGTAYWFLQSEDTRIFTTAPANNGSFEMLGLLNLTENQYGLAQIDVDGGMQKMIFLSESMTADNQPDEAKHPEVLDNANTVASLRSGGLSLFADLRSLRMLSRFQQSKALDDGLKSGNLKPFHLQDLVKGYRIDIFDDFSQQWHSLHQRHERYTIGEDDRALIFTAEDQEGLVQLSATRSAAEGAGDELYLHESIMRWAGWSLSVPLPGIALNSDGDPAKAMEEEAKNPAVTPFKVRPEYIVVPGTLPSLRFGRAYALRARVVDLAGNSLGVKDPIADFFAFFMGMPNADKRFPYLRFEPVDSPLVLMRDEKALTSPGSELLRIVIRSFNDGIDNDGIAVDLSANDRMILPPRTSVEMAERLGMLDDENGKLRNDPAIYDLLAQRDGAELNTVEVLIAGNLQKAPIETAETMSGVPYIPDGLARGAALRNLPGVEVKGIGSVAPGADPDAPVHFKPLHDANPRPGSATLVSFEVSGNWQNVLPFRIALAEGASGPNWDAGNRLLTVFLPKGTMHVSPLSSYMLPDDLEKMGQWQWIKEFIELSTGGSPQEATLDIGLTVDRIQHILQRAVEGGHWMLTPPQLITFVHAVQQPIGIPAFEQILVQRSERNLLQTLLERKIGPVKNQETNILTSWRALNSTNAYLIGGLRLHVPSAAKVDLYANWSDPVDDLRADEPDVVNQAAFVDEIPLQRSGEGVVERDGRPVAYLIPEENLLVFNLEGDELGSDTDEGRNVYTTAAPLHEINDTKHHHIHYTPVASSRYREYFDDKTLDFTRAGASVSVHVPASARPVAPEILYVIPTFGWQRQTETAVKRSVRFGGGLRIYMNRPWYSSGEGELLGILSTYNVDTDDPNSITAWKPFTTQWGADPIWREANSLRYFPNQNHFKDSVAAEYDLSLEETAAPGTVNVSGYTPVFDKKRKLWYCDVTIDSENTYMPFIRLALARYQPYALQSVKLSRVVTADFIQLLPNRALVILPDAYRKNNFRFNLSGPAPDGPRFRVVTPAVETFIGPLELRVWMQQHNPAIPGDLGWEDVSDDTVSIEVNEPVNAPKQQGIKIWQGAVQFNRRMELTRYRLVFEEREYFSASSPNRPNYASRVVYLETLEI